MHSKMYCVCLIIFSGLMFFCEQYTRKCSDFCATEIESGIFGICRFIYCSDDALSRIIFTFGRNDK